MKPKKTIFHAIVWFACISSVIAPMVFFNDELTNSIGTSWLIIYTYTCACLVNILGSNKYISKSASFSTMPFFVSTCSLVATLTLSITHTIANIVANNDGVIKVDFSSSSISLGFYIAFLAPMIVALILSFIADRMYRNEYKRIIHAEWVEGVKTLPDSKILAVQTMKELPERIDLEKVSLHSLETLIQQYKSIKIHAESLQNNMDKLVKL